MARLSRSLEALGRIGAALETGLLVILLLSIIGLSTAQIVLRNFFDLGFYWSEGVLQTLVLWIALIGAVAASRSDRHISISLVDTLVGPRLKCAIKALTHAFAAVMSGLLTWFSLDFVMTTREYGDVAFGTVPAWILQLALPVGFGLIGYRYILFFLVELVRLISGRAGREET